MTKKKNQQGEVVLTAEESQVDVGASDVQAPGAPARLSDIDRMALELARQQRLTALADAKAAIAQNEKAELAYKYVVLQLYMKYGLTDADAISEAGDIVKNGALMAAQQQQKNQ